MVSTTTAQEEYCGGGGVAAKRASRRQDHDENRGRDPRRIGLASRARRAHRLATAQSEGGPKKSESTPPDASTRAPPIGPE